MIASRIFGSYFDEAAEAHDFYDSNQWTDEERAELEERGLIPYVSNQIASRINNVTGSEIVTRTRLKFTPRTSDENAVQAADAMTKLVMWLQEANSSSFKWSQLLLKTRISGLAYHHLLPIQDTIREEIYSGLDGFFDYMDRTINFTNSRGMGLWKWMSREELRLKWPEKAESIDSACGGFSSDALLPPSNVFSRRLTLGNTGYFDNDNDLLLVVYFYYRIPKKFYSYLSKKGQSVNTFYKAEAEKNAKSKKDIAENMGYQVRQCIFSGNILFDEGEYPYQLDYYQGLLPITALCINREDNTGKPYGLVRSAKDDQKLFNKKQAKINWHLDARQIVADSDAIDDIENLAEEAARPDGIILKRPGKELRIEKNLDEIQVHAASLEGHIRSIERNMGIFDEATGAETNATSGRAIQLRKSGSQTTQAMTLDLLRQAKRDAGRKMALMAQMKFTDRMMFSIVGKDGQVEVQQINEPVLGPDDKPEEDPDGNIIRKPDITTFQFSVNLEEAPDTATLDQDAKQRLADLIVAGANPANFTPGMLKTLGIPEENDLYQEAAQNFQQKLQQAQAALAENEKLKATLAKLQGQPQNSGGNPVPVVPTGGVPGNVQ
ncbi:hypothetical protein [Rhizobium sp. Nf11,1]|uniref:portal protein n=1 Tax=Rhizobium sp. Nf11,1 TaxID=3404923 RepID=UPI003D32BA70